MASIVILMLLVLSHLGGWRTALSFDLAMGLLRVAKMLWPQGLGAANLAVPVRFTSCLRSDRSTGVSPAWGPGQQSPYTYVSTCLLTLVETGQGAAL